MKETRKNRRWGTALRRAAAFFLCAACLLGGTGTSHAEEKPLRGAPRFLYYPLFLPWNGRLTLRLFSTVEETQG